MEGVDFLIIGAQKSGTTSLHMYLREHPQIFMPLSKELDFFSNESRFNRGKEWYLKTFFSRARDMICGESSPHYMMFSAVPQRICNMFPEVKIIALLRNPIDRCFSHYTMAVGRGVEERSFLQVITDTRARKMSLPFQKTQAGNPDETEYYLTLGRYNMVLENYLKFFKRENVLLLFSEELRDNPRAAMKKAFAFLGVDSSYVPGNITKKYHVGGKQRFPFVEKFLFRTPRVKPIVKFIAGSRKNYETFYFWFRQFNIAGADRGCIMPRERDILKKFYEDDVRALKEAFGVDISWEDFVI